VLLGVAQYRRALFLEGADRRKGVYDAQVIAFGWHARADGDPEAVGALEPRRAATARKPTRAPDRVTPPCALPPL
jgi:hypothetical protein